MPESTAGQVVRDWAGQVVCKPGSLEGCAVMYSEACRSVDNQTHRIRTAKADLERMEVGMSEMLKEREQARIWLRETIDDEGL